MKINELKGSCYIKCNNQEEMDKILLKLRENGFTRDRQSLSFFFEGEFIFISKWNSVYSIEHKEDFLEMIYFNFDDENKSKSIIYFASDF